MKPVIEAYELSKRYLLGRTFADRKDLERKAEANQFGAKQSLRSAPPSLWAIKDVSFEMRQGEILGVIGRNGSGKTTLLKVLSKITAPTSGKAILRGRVSSLLEIGTGFHPDLSGRENIFLNGTIHGLRKVEIQKMFEDIVSFAELENFIDTPVKHYSSGMYVRLAFSVAAHLKPEILIIDEALAVGDYLFQEKCIGKVRDVTGQGATAIFVSHQLASVKNLCRSAILMEKGQVVSTGTSEEVVDLYIQKNMQEKAASQKVIHQDNSGEFWIIETYLHNSRSQKTKTLSVAEKFTFHMIFEVKKPVKDIRIGVGFLLPEGTVVASMHQTDAGLPAFSGDCGVYHIFFEIRNPLLSGNYRLSAGAHRVFNHQTIEYIPSALDFEVINFSNDSEHKKMQIMRYPGIVHFGAKWSIPERVN